MLPSEEHLRNLKPLNKPIHQNKKKWKTKHVRTHTGDLGGAWSASATLVLVELGKRSTWRSMVVEPLMRSETWSCRSAKGRATTAFIGPSSSDPRRNRTGASYRERHAHFVELKNRSVGMESDSITRSQPPAIPPYETTRVVLNFLNIDLRL